MEEKWAWARAKGEVPKAAIQLRRRHGSRCQLIWSGRSNAFKGLVKGLGVRRLSSDLRGELGRTCDCARPRHMEER
jgi:hypothetical protein